MPLFAELQDEHRLLDQLAGSLMRCAERIENGEADAADVHDFVKVFRVFVDGYHHDREERLLKTLVERAEVPGDRGPVPIIADEHRQTAEMITLLEASAKDTERSPELARRIARHLWEHIDKEESVILPEARQRLIRSGVPKIEGRQATPEEEAARSLGEELARRFPPLDDPEMIRGDGCIACSKFGETCGGIEMEWWNDWEMQHYRSLDEG
jgi:hemerythrin-like domain-containing protein